MPLTEADSVVRSLWESDAPAWDRYWVPIFSLFARQLAHVSSPSRGDVILDVGTGSGLAVRELCKTRPSVGLAVGIDLKSQSSSIQKLGMKLLRKPIVNPAPGIKYTNAFVYSDRLLLELVTAEDGASGQQNPGNFRQAMRGSIEITHLGVRVRDLDAAAQDEDRRSNDDRRAP